MIQAMPLKVHVFSALPGQGDTQRNPSSTASGAVGQRFESSRAHHRSFLQSDSYGTGAEKGSAVLCASGTYSGPLEHGLPPTLRAGRPRPPVSFWPTSDTYKAIWLGAVGREHEEAVLTEPDTTLSLLDARLVGELARIADKIEQALGGRM